MERPRVYIRDKANKFSRSDLNLIGDIMEKATLSWGRHLSAASSLTIDLSIQPDLDPAVATTYVEYTVPVASKNGERVVTSVAAYKLATGFDFNGDLPDVKINFSYETLRSSLAENKPGYIYTIFVHELGHALFLTALKHYNVYDHIAVFDLSMRDSPGEPRFAGPNSVRIAGESVPISHVTGTHLAPDAAAEFRSPLGPTILRGDVRSIAPLDVAMASDCGLPTALDDTILIGQFPGTVDGGAGFDTAAFDGFRDSYKPFRRGPDWVVTHLPTGYENTLRNVEQLQFREPLGPPDATVTVTLPTSADEISL
jgi:hypothetical protein